MAREPSTDAIVTTRGVKFWSLVRKRWTWAAVGSALFFIGGAGGAGYRDRIGIGNKIDNNYTAETQAIAAVMQTVKDVDAESRHRDEMAKQEADFNRRETFYLRQDVKAVADRVEARLVTPPPTSQPAISVR